MLVKNAQNLMRAVIRTVHAAEAACMKVCTCMTYNNSTIIIMYFIGPECT